ncbi:Tetraspannin-domain-containing protein [Linnemannia elongata AG-77]|uniref:Tetraspannin-domain-containing protein n=1 Tax=Linnemannia elongata AG-77 TaxID=1314771 RepID=A0A197K5Y5_9FUNG|nr:Tetraspannin-domain-containing protein [Linnemannia elongata AG-77]
MDLMHIHRQPSRLYILILNFVTLLASLMLFAAGILELAGGHSQFPLHSDAIAWGLIILSLVVFLVSILGGVTALSPSRRIAYTYGTLLSILVVLQLTFLIYAMIRHDHVDIMMDNAWQKAYDTDERALQDLETRLHCCGYENVTDRAVPKTYKEACLNSPAFGYGVSCKQQLQDAYYDHERMIIAAITGVEALQLLALLATIALLKKLPSDDMIEDRYSAEHSQRLLRGLRNEDEGRAGYGDQSGTAETRGGYGSTPGQ